MTFVELDMVFDGLINIVHKKLAQKLNCDRIFVNPTSGLTWKAQPAVLTVPKKVFEVVQGCFYLECFQNNAKHKMFFLRNSSSF